MSTETLKQILTYIKQIDDSLTVDDRFELPTFICNFSTAKKAAKGLKEMGINAESALIYLNDSPLRSFPIARIDGWTSEIDEPLFEGDEEGYEDKYSSAIYRYAIVIKETDYGY